MKILCILFLFSLALFTGTSSQAVDDALVKPVPSIAAAATTLMAPIEKAERELDKIYVKIGRAHV